jgi:hypothetical protein
MVEMVMVLDNRRRQQKLDMVNLELLDIPCPIYTHLRHRHRRQRRLEVTLQRHHQQQQDSQL